MVNACCAMRQCGVALCPQHLAPNDKGSADRRHKFCPSCIVKTPRCTSCGIQGVDQAFNSNRETGGHYHHRHRALTLWPCGNGCYNLLCQRCGTQQDGCSLHRRKEPCGKWFRQWGIRRFEGLCHFQASIGYLTAGEEAQYQAALAIDSRGPQPSAQLHTLPNAAAPDLLAAQAHNNAAAPHLPASTQLLPLDLPMGLSAAQQLLMTPQLLPDGTTLYPGETTQIQHEPCLLDLQDLDQLEALTPSPAACHHPGDVFLDERLRDTEGNPLDEYTDPVTGDKWLCHPGQGDFVCWVRITRPISTHR